MNSFAYYNPTRLYNGPEQIEKNLAKEIAVFGKKVLLVYGGGSIKRSGLYDRVTGLLKEGGIEYVELSGVEPNPRLTSVNKGIELCRTHGVSLVLPVGGGSVLDASKAIAAGAKYDGDVWDFFIGKAVIQEALPVGAILTLAATGSEMNGNFVISHWENQEKRGAGSIHAYPKFSFCDPNLTKTVPLDQTSNGTVDMFAHVMENYFTHTKNIPLQEQLAESLMRTIVEYGPRGMAEPDNYEVREVLMYCGTMALNGMVSMGTTGDWACHGIEHEISAIYDIPHGGGLAIVFPRWMIHVMDENLDKFVRFAVHVFGVNPEGKEKRDVALEGVAMFREFLAQVQAPASLADYGIGDENISVMAEKSVHRGPIGQFKKLAKEDVETILRNSLQP